MLFTGLSHDRITRALQKAGFWISKSFGTKHTGFTDGRRKLTIPRHNPINPYTLKGIIRDAVLTDEEFKKFL